MPYVNIKVTREGVTSAQKADLIQGVTDLLVRVLAKPPATTFVVIDEVEMEDWGIGGLPVEEFRRRQAPAGTRQEAQPIPIRTALTERLDIVHPDLPAPMAS